MNDVLTLILGGGRGNRLFPLTHMRSKPAVPLGGKYRLIDIPISNCLHAGLKRIFVLTQFNSASLNRHIAQTYRLDMFSEGFVEVLAAEQTPDSSDWFQGTADAVRQAARHFTRIRRRLLSDPRRRSPLPHGLLRADRVAHRGPRRHHHRGAAGHGGRRDRRWASSRSTTSVRSTASRKSRPRTPRARSAAALPEDRLPADDRRASRSSPRWASTSSIARSCSTSWPARRRLRQGDHSQGARRPTSCSPVHLSRLLGRRRHDRGVLRRQHPADRRDAPFNFFHPRWPIYTHPRFLPAHARLRLPHRIARSSPKAATSTSAISRTPSSAFARISALARQSRDRSCSARTTTKRTPARQTSRSGSAATSCSIASSSTRTPGSPTACGWSTQAGSSTPTATATTSATASSSSPKARS